MIPGLPELAAGVGLLLAIVVGLRVLFLIATRLLRRTIDIAAFEGPEKLAGLAGMHHQLRAELERFQNEGGGAGLNFVFAPDQKVEFPSEIKALAPAAGPLVELANFLPSRTRIVKGVVHESGDRGLGVTISIGGSTGRVGATTTIWERDVVPAIATAQGTPEQCQRLVLAAAAWVAYQLLHRARTTDRAALLSQDWESYAHFSVAARLQAAGQVGAARMGYATALDRDPRNRGALFNLGVLDIGDASNDAAYERLTAVLGEIDDLPAVRPREMDRLWYRATYNQAVAAWHRFLVGPAVAEDADAARSASECVVRQADRMLRELGGTDAMWLGGANADFARFLAMVRGAALTLYADTVRPR